MNMKRDDDDSFNPFVFCRGVSIVAEAAKTPAPTQRKGYQILSEGGRSQANSVLGKFINTVPWECQS